MSKYFNWHYGHTSEVAQAKLWEVKERLKCRGWRIEHPVRKYFSKLDEIMFPRRYTLYYEVWKYDRKTFHLVVKIVDGTYYLYALRNNILAPITQPPFEEHHLKYWELVDKFRIDEGRKITIDLSYVR